MARLNVNGKAYDVDVAPDTPLLWAIRENIGLTGTKYGCGIAQCGACTVHIDGVPTRSCSFPASAAEGKQITTIEGLAAERPAHQGAAGLDRQRRAAMRLLPERHDHGGDGAPQGQAEADRRRYRCGDHQYLPLRHLSAGAHGDPRSRERVRGGVDELLCRTSIAAPSWSARAPPGLALGFHIPFAGEASAAQSPGPR